MNPLNNRSDGREPYIFKADKAEELLGVHADLIAMTLSSRKKILYLLYSPIYDVKGWYSGIYVEPASHALAVTENRFIISEDRHIKGIVPTIQTIPFTQVLCVELGRSLLLGWLVIRFVEKEALSNISFFLKATGIHHFAAAIREYRRMASSRILNRLQSKDTRWTEFWQSIPNPQVNLLKLLIIEGERPMRMVRSSESWGMGKKRRNQVCLATDGVFLQTDFGFIHIANEPRIRPNMLNFGVKVCCIPLEVLKSAVRIEKKEGEIPLHILRLELERISVSIPWDIPFDRGDNIFVENFVHSLQDALQEGKNVLRWPGPGNQ